MQSVVAKNSTKQNRTILEGIYRRYFNVIGRAKVTNDKFIEGFNNMKDEISLLSGEVTNLTSLAEEI